MLGFGAANRRKIGIDVKFILRVSSWKEGLTGVSGGS